MLGHVLLSMTLEAAPAQPASAASPPPPRWTRFGEATVNDIAGGGSRRGTWAAEGPAMKRWLVDNGVNIVKHRRIDC